MKLSTKGRYGVRLMVHLAMHVGEGPVFLKDIARHQDISEKYLWQLIQPLKISGLVNSTRGAHGGYTLAKKPNEISLLQIIQVLEGPICIVDCVDHPDLCKRSGHCSARELWGEISGKISEILGRVSLDELAHKQQKREM